jgi:hypothetical protein
MIDAGVTVTTSGYLSAMVLYEPFFLRKGGGIFHYQADFVNQSIRVPRMGIYPSSLWISLLCL